MNKADKAVFIINADALRCNWNYFYRIDEKLSLFDLLFYLKDERRIFLKNS